MNKDLLLVSLRNGALYLEPEKTTSSDIDYDDDAPDRLSQSTILCLEQLMKSGYTLDERGLRMLNRLGSEDKADIVEAFNDFFGKSLNWTPLVKGWTQPTYETSADHLITLFYNIFINLNGIDPADADKLPCGHYIPHGTFDLSRYNGCPFCGQPFNTSDFVIKSQGSALKTLKGWNEDDVFGQLLNLMRSTVPLSAEQSDSLCRLLDVFEIPDVDVPMRETAIIVALMALEYGEIDAAMRYLKSPADVLRMLWFEKTRQLQIIKPRTMVRSAIKYGSHVTPIFDQSAFNAVEMEAKLKLWYPRKRCRQIAHILNSMDIETHKACEIMHPNRGMWVRFIRALRLAEYSKRKGYENLRLLLDCFYKGDYVVMQGLVDMALDMHKYNKAIELLSERPGMFARQLFSLMLKCNPYRVLGDFKRILDKVPLRLLISLGNNADTYFRNTTNTRTIRTITGLDRSIPVNPRLNRLDVDERIQIVKAVNDLMYDALAIRYAKNPMPGKKIYIDPALYRVVLPVGDRVKVASGVMSVPQGSTFDVLGDKIRLFLHWGKDMHAAPIDLDLSAAIIYPNDMEICNYGNLTTADVGATHSGDMRAIPEMVGTAEYIELDLDVLRRRGAEYVAFTANQYTVGALQPNAMVGWMDSKFPMTVDNATGVAYDPSCVQQMVKIDDSMLTKGIVFGVLDVKHNAVIWLEMQFDGQTIYSLDHLAVLNIINKLSQKVTIGKALEVMAQARGMVIVESKDDVDDDTTVYDRQWAYDLAAVTNLLVPDDD